MGHPPKFELKYLLFFRCLHIAGSRQQYDEFQLELSAANKSPALIASVSTGDDVTCVAINKHFYLASLGSNLAGI